MKNIKDLFKEQLNWKKDATISATYISEQYPKEECHLRMNDFPDEPMWTLFYKDESLDFDDEPSNWKIKYISET